MRAWCVAHSAPAAVLAMVAATTVLVAGSEWLLPVPGQARRIPFWQLTPAVLAVLASVMTVNALPVAGARRRVAAARAAWAGVVTLLAAGCALLVDRATGLPSLVPGVAVAVGLTFAASTAVGRMSVWVGGAIAVVVLTRVTQVAATDDLWAGLGGRAQVAAVVLVAVGLAAYSWCGTPCQDG